AAGDRSVAREEHRTAPQLRDRAHAVRTVTPRGRCGAYRAADGSQGIESRGRRRPRAGAGPRRVLSRRPPYTARGGFGPGARATVEGHALFLVVHDALAPLLRRSICPASAVGGVGVPRRLRFGCAVTGRKLRRAEL